MITVKDIFGKQHTIKRCVSNDIPTHFAKIKDVIPPKEALEFYLRMEECIQNKTAFALSDDSCFLYYKNYKPALAHAVAVYGKNEAVKILALGFGIFTQIDKKTFKLDFVLHPGKFVAEYKSILTAFSIKQFHKTGHPLIIRIDLFKEKMAGIYKQRGLT